MFVFVVSLDNTDLTPHEAAMETDAFDNNATTGDFSSPVDVAATTDETNAAMTLIRLNQPDQSNNPFHYVSMYFNMVSVPVGLFLNVLCIVMLINSKIARTSTAVEIIFLAIADSINLITFFVASWPVW